MQKWVTGGAPPEKLILGLTAAATTFTLYNLTANFSGVGVKVDRPGKPGPYIQQEGHVTYYRVSTVMPTKSDSDVIVCLQLLSKR